MTVGPGNITGFRNQFVASRSNRYLITPSGPLGQPLGLDVQHMQLFAKATSVPGTQIGMIPVGYRGRIIKFAGERQYGEWVIQVYDGTIRGEQGNGNIRKIMEDWIERTNSSIEHKVRLNTASESPWEVAWFDTNGDGYGRGSGDFSQKFLLHNCWPIDISPIDLSYDQADAFSEFTLTLAYDFHSYPRDSGSGGSVSGGSVSGGSVSSSSV